ncbi:Flp family type IVb pilin [Hoeflea alexandrii]|uniref:Flp family type IVb pilin n=1 Tax=Hoeflea alexandrii TaxID=288436 RepID=UPI0022AEE145|nr:Flp family type IVb pilin [Hoeflea alexandrii]MCZ4289902.1 Flp family type IVb pilin [Hoeflea alexandrii]
MKSLFCRFIEDRSGATAIEYGLIAALIAAALVSGMTAIGGAINNNMDGVANHIKNSQ